MPLCHTAAPTRRQQHHAHARLHARTHTHAAPPVAWRPPGSFYQPSKRSQSWIKLKRDYVEGLADSLDLVPIGAWHGQGRKVRQQTQGCRQHGLVRLGMQLLLPRRRRRRWPSALAVSRGGACCPQLHRRLRAPH